MSSDSNRTTLWLGAALVFVAMTALGWKLGAASGANDATTSATPAPSENAADAALAQARERSTRARRQVGAIRRGASPEQRLRATIELANTLSTDEFAHWIDGGWFDFRSGFELTLFRRIVEERWRLEDPEGFVAWCLKDGQNSPAWSVSTPKGAALPLLTEWALHHPERLDSFFAKHPDDALEAQLVSRLAAEHPAQAAARLKDLVARGTGRNNYQLYSAFFELAKAAPEAVEAILDELPGSVRRQAERALVTQRLSVSFEDEIRSLWQRPDGWWLFSSHLHVTDGLSGKLLAELPNFPASWRNGLTTHSLHTILYNGNAEPWFAADLEGAGFTAEQAQSIRGTALSVITSKSPERALELLADADLPENTRRNLVSNLFQRVRNDPEKAETWLAMLDSDTDREIAQGVIDAANTSTTTTQRRYQTPDEWIDGALGEDLGRMGGYYLGSALRSWNAEQIGELTERFRKLPAGEKDRVAAALSEQHGSPIFDHAAPALAGEIVRHLVTSSSPVESEEESSHETRQANTTRMASGIAVRWVIQDAPAASAWVESLPDSESKQWARNNLAATWANYDPEAMQSWLRSLPPDAREDVRAYLDNPEGAE